jgi:hypothetical protein
VNSTFKSLEKSPGLPTPANLASPNRQRGSLKSLAGAATLLPMLVLLSADVALAQGIGWTANATVIKLVVTGDGGVNVRLSPDVTGCQSQSNYGPNFASIYPNHPGINRMKADLLAAFMNGTPVSLYLIDSNCTVGEMILGGW